MSQPAFVPLMPRPRPRRAFLVTLPLHVFRELAWTSGAALLIFAALLLAYTVSRLMRDDMSVGAILRLLPSLIPLVGPEAMPGAVITGVLVTYGRLVSDREYLAAQAGGVHPLWLAAPAGALAGLASFLAVFLNEFTLEPAVERNVRVFIEDQKNMMDRKLGRPGSITLPARGQPMALCRLPDLPGPGGRVQSGLEMVLFAPGGPGARRPDAEAVWDPAWPWPVQRVTARSHRRGPVASDAGRLWVNIDLWNASYWDFPGGRIREIPVTAGRGSIPVGADPRQAGHISARNALLWSMSKLADSRREWSADRVLIAHELESMEADPDTAPETVSAARQSLQDASRRAREAGAMLHWKLALATACLGFAFLGVPMGLATHRTGVAATGFMMGAAVAAAYYVAMKVISRQAESGALSEAFLWVPNLCLVAGGLFFAGKARRRAI